MKKLTKIAVTGRKKGGYKPDSNCPNCKGSGGVQTGENEYSTCPCVFEKEEPRKKK